MIKTDTINNRYNQVQTTKLYTVTVQFELKLPYEIKGQESIYRGRPSTIKVIIKIIIIAVNNLNRQHV